MNEIYDDLIYKSGLIADGCWDELGTYEQEAIERLIELTVLECCKALNPMLRDMISRGQGVDLIKLHFGMDPKEITTAMLDAAIEQCKRELAKKKLGVEE
jgi:hypothetical protein